jgi:hypothetical protein
MQRAGPSRHGRSLHLAELSATPRILPADEVNLANVEARVACLASHLVSIARAIMRFPRA